MQGNPHCDAMLGQHFWSLAQIATSKKLGKIVDRLDFPCGGIFSLYPWQEVGNGLRRMQSRLKERGSPFDKPLFALIFLPFVTLPALRITARGLVNAKERRIVPLFAD